MPKPKIGLLTGTFDPVHMGHIELAKGAIEACGLTEVWFLMNAHPAHKASVSDYDHRLEMLRLAIKSEEKLLSYEGELSGWPHTMQTFDELTSSYPSLDFVFVVGADTLGRLDSWQDQESVVKNASYAVGRRSGNGTERIDGLRRRLGALGDSLQLQLFDFNAHETASSTAVRSAMLLGERPLSLDPRVYEYAISHQLYPKLGL